MKTSRSSRAGASVITIDSMTERDLLTSDQIMRLAFGAYLGIPDPMDFLGDAECLRTRWRADPTGGFCARDNGEIIGAVYATHWGSVGYFGPLVVHPDHWDQGVGSALLEPVIARFDEWGVTHAGLYTFAQSPKHVWLYQKFGFWPRHLTAITSKPIHRAPPNASGWTYFSDIPTGERALTLAACREVTDAIYVGLDVSLEINAVAEQKLGDTVLIWDEPTGGSGSRLAGFAVCHCGPGSEAGSGVCYIKFAAIRPDPQADATFGRLLGACEAMSAERGLSRLSAGVNMARHEAYRRLLARGFRTDIQGVTMHSSNAVGYDQPDIYLLDDWR